MNPPFGAKNAAFRGGVCIRALPPERRVYAAAKNQPRFLPKRIGRVRMRPEAFALS